MSSSKLDAKHEKTLKALLKLPDNRRCAVCESLGPQYVVINFSTFVCTNCSGIHRQFNHRCKGITMATFKPEEMRAIEEGGNAVALAKYLAKWSPSDLPKPIDRSVAKVRDFIEIVFVKRRFYSADAPVPSSLRRLPEDGWAAFGDAAPPLSDASGGAATNGQSAVPIGPASHAGGWAQFDAPAAATAPDTPKQAAAGGGQGGGGGVSGWQAFGEPLASANGDAKPHAAAPAQPPTRKELPSDLFCELPPQPQAPPVFGSGACTAPADVFGGGFPPRPPADFARSTFSASGFHGSGGGGGGLQSAGNSLVASSGVLGSPEGSVRSAASEVAAPDPFSAFAPVMRAALPATGPAPGGDVAPGGGGLLPSNMPPAQYGSAPDFAGSAFGAAAGGPAFGGGGFEAPSYAMAQPSGFEVPPYGAPHAAAFQAAPSVGGAPPPLQFAGGSFAPPKSSGNPFA
ncbi:hypothetical protein WJX81_007487 [Elliptochloris bilobata]|uniref:Arf-GAP domain-containing protein n=1 Tax=Elliptochloris bilobata TaxID=381761 RepID=A0AAW1S9Q5_9CHLO